MNLIEGSKRMHHAGRILVPIALGLIAVFIAFMIFVYQSNYFVIRDILRLFLPLFIWLCGIALTSGALLWIAGWILEGFIQHPSEN